MTPRFPPLAAPAAPLVAAYQPAMSLSLPRWLHSLPFAELMVLGMLGVILAFA